MTSRSFQHDCGAFLSAKAALNPAVVTAGSTAADGVEVDGTAIDRQSYTNPGSDMPLSCIVVVEAYEALATAETATVKFNLQHADSSTGAWADYDDKDGSTANTINLTTASGGTELQADFDLGSAKRWIRVQVTPTLSATSSDTVDYGGVVVFGGFGFDPPT